jgi:hypothetical protein
MDVERRVLTFFGGEEVSYDVPLRRTLLALMREVWRDWSIEWAHEGVVDVAERAGVPREHVLTVELETGTDDIRPPEQPDWTDLVGSVRRPDGTVRLFPLAGERSTPSRCAMTGCRSASRSVRLSCHERSPHWWGDVPGRDPLPECRAHVTA